MKHLNFNGLNILLIAPPTLWFIAAFGPGQLPLRWFNTSETVSAYVIFFLAFTLGILTMWQLTKRLKAPEFSDKLMLLLMGLFALKGFFGVFLRFLFNPWISLWLFAPFLLMACAKGEGWQYLKKYLWYPIVLDSLVLIYGYWFGNLAQTLKDVSILNLMALLFAYIALLVGFVKYTEWTYEPAKPRWYIPTVILAIPAFTIGLFITFLFLIMF